MVSHLTNTQNPSLAPSFDNIEASNLLEMGGKSKRYFISGVNSLLGHSLFEELRNDHIAIHTGAVPNKFVATINTNDE
jgi:hypothetical protein